MDNAILHHDTLHSRARRLTRTGEPTKLDPVNTSVQFLRGFFSRATFCLPALYHFLGSAYAKETDIFQDDGALAVARAYAEFSGLNTLTLCCRKIFDHDPNRLTGAKFAKMKDPDLRRHAEYWATRSSKDLDEVWTALIFLRNFFKEFSKNDTELLSGKTPLHMRIGLLKQHANRAAAHLTLDDYAIACLDVLHFTAAIVLVAEIVKCFDMANLGGDYFNRIDASSREAALKIFPCIKGKALFCSVSVEQQARLHVLAGWDQSLEILAGLPNTIIYSAFCNE
jgi:hypothetical protein